MPTVQKSMRKRATGVARPQRTLPRRPPQRGGAVAQSSVCRDRVGAAAMAAVQAVAGAQVIAAGTIADAERQRLSRLRHFGSKEALQPVQMQSHSSSLSSDEAGR